MAKRTFDDIGAAYKAVELDKRDDGKDVQSLLQDMTGATTVGFFSEYFFFNITNTHVKFRYIFILYQMYIVK